MSLACSKLQNIKWEDTSFHLLPLSLCPSVTPLSWCVPSVPAGLKGKFGHTVSVQSYKWFWAQNVTCCRHCTTKTQRPFDMWALNSPHLPCDHRLRLNIGRERQMRHTLNFKCTDTRASGDLYLKKNGCLLCFSLFMYFVLCEALSNCSIKYINLKWFSDSGQRFSKPSNTRCATTSNSN